MEIKVAPHSSAGEKCSWKKRFEVACLPPIGAEFTITEDMDQPMSGMVGFVSQYLFKDPSGEIVVKVKLYFHDTNAIERICSSSPGWEKY